MYYNYNINYRVSIISVLNGAGFPCEIDRHLFITCALIACELLRGVTHKMYVPCACAYNYGAAVRQLLAYTAITSTPLSIGQFTPSRVLSALRCAAGTFDLSRVVVFGRSFPGIDISHGSVNSHVACCHTRLPKPRDYAKTHTCAA